MNKQVSVIIPNYNYARFLQRRIDCIINQTIKPAEIIFLDDCSTDNSLEVAQEILSNTDIPYRIIPNEVNQGVFKQWLKGVELTQYNYFWIAEADDFCELNFLEILLPAFDDKDVVISYCQSKIIDQDNKFIANELEYKSKFFDGSRWKNSFINNSTDEVKDYLCIQNTIPNASALVFNKNLLDITKVSQSTSYKMCGDWVFYVQSLLSKDTNKISYNSNILNNFVRHEKSVFGNSNSKLLLNQEFYKVYYFICLQIEISNALKEKIFVECVRNFFWFPENNETLEYLLKLTTELGFTLDLIDIKRHVYNDLKSHNDWLSGQVENYKLALSQKEDGIKWLEGQV
ncbi:MAG: glycosyltransferase family 2 protein, partial [Proteobacteria bacterium]